MLALVVMMYLRTRQYYSVPHHFFIRKLKWWASLFRNFAALAILKGGQYNSEQCQAGYPAPGLSSAQDTHGNHREVCGMVLQAHSVIYHY